MASKVFPGCNDKEASKGTSTMPRRSVIWTCCRTQFMYFADYKAHCQWPIIDWFIFIHKAHWIKLINLPQIHLIFHPKCLSSTVARFQHQACSDYSHHYLSQFLCCYLAVQWWFWPSWKLRWDVRLIPWPKHLRSSGRCTTSPIHKAHQIIMCTVNLW